MDVGSVTGRAGASQRVTLTGSLPVCMIRRKTKATTDILAEQIFNYLFADMILESWIRPV